MKKPRYNFLRIHEATYKRLVASGLPGETRTEMIERLLDHYVVCSKARDERLQALAEQVAAAVQPRR